MGQNAAKTNDHEVVGRLWITFVTANPQVETAGEE
jgi:hypothetical protein